MATETPNPVGRPPKWESVEALTTLIEAYFNSTPKEEWTITGLALALDTTRQTLLDYEHKDDFTYTVKKAKLMVENSYEIDLKKSGRSGTIFALKNFDWKDTQNTDITTKGEKIVVLPSEIYAKHDLTSQPSTDSE